MASTPRPSPNHPSNNGNVNGNGSAGRSYVPMLPPTPVVVDDGDDFDLGSLVTVLKRRALTFMGVASVTTLGLIFWHITRPPAYRGAFELLVEPVTVVNKLDLGAASFLNGGDEQSGLDYNSQIRVLRSPTVLEPILADIQQRYPQITYYSLLSQLSINRVDDAKVLNIAYSGTDPVKIEFILQQLAQGFINYSVQDRQADLRRGIEFLDQQLDQKWQEVDAIESDLSDFQKEYDLVDIDAVSASVTERMNAMLGQQEALQVELASLGTLYDNLRQQVGFTPDAAVRVANLSESPQYQALLAEYRQIEQQIALESARFQADTPMVQALEDRRQQLLPLLQEEAARTLGTSALDPQQLGFQGGVSQSLVQQLVETANQIQVLETQSGAITEVVEVLQSEIQYLADLGRSFQQIQRELAVAEGSLNELLATRQELRFQMARQNAPWELMTPLNAANVAPLTNLPRKLVLSGVVGLLLGAAAALLQDKLDRVFHSTEEIIETTKLPALATIPYVKALESRALLMQVNLVTTVTDLVGQRPLVVSHASPTSFAFAEAFYSLHTNLRLLGSDTPMQVITITSAQSGEGKSTISAHLAIAATNMDRRVLILDADMRQPNQHKIFGLQNRTGLSNLITSNHDTPADMIQPVPGNSNLHILSAGVQPPAPGGLLSSRRMQGLVQSLRQEYDLLIIDTPPMMGITDAKLASTHADGLLLVTQMGQTTRSEVQRVLSDLNNTIQAPLLGLVVNGVTGRNPTGYYNAYYNNYYAHSTS